jgi:hypothetical protein
VYITKHEAISATFCRQLPPLLLLPLPLPVLGWLLLVVTGLSLWSALML